MNEFIKAHNLSKSFNGNTAVDGINISVAEGEICGLVGPDGAGKTTTLRLLCGALSPDDRGDEDVSIRIGGQDMLHQPELARAQIGYLPQRFSLYEELTVIENIRFFAEVRGLKSSEWRPRCLDILEFVGLARYTNRRAGHLSGGMKQKLGLAAALVHQPPVLLLDEPTTGVDPVTRQDFWQLIIRLAAPTKQDGSGTAILVTTPYMDEAARCSRVGFMQGGRILTEGRPASLWKQLEGRILELQGEPLPLLRSLSNEDKDVENAQMFGDRLHLRVREGKVKKVRKRLLEKIPAGGGKVRRIRPIQPQLEDVFILFLERKS